MILALLIFILLLMASLIFTYMLSSVLDGDKIHNDPAIEAVVQTNLSLMLLSTIDLATDVFALVTGKIMVFVSGLPAQALNIARFGVVIGAAIIFHESYTYFLSGGDTIFRTLLGPLFQDVIFSIFQVFRLIYDAIIPLYNYYILIIGQATRGSLTIALRCDFENVIDTIRLIIYTFVSLFKSTIDFAGGTEIDNNAMVNEWNITQTITNAQMVIATQEKTAACVCDGLKDVFDLAFVLVNTPHIPRLLNHVWNIPISLIQEIIQILPPYTKMPVFTRTVYHFGGVLFESASYVDTIIVRLFEKVIQLFIPEFYLKGVPEQFVFATVSRVFLFVIEFLHVLFRTAIHMIIPIPKFITNPDYMMQAADFSRSILQLDLFLHGIFNHVHWVGLLTSKSIMGALTNAVTGQSKFVLEGVPDHVVLDCHTFKNKGYIKAPCAAYLSLKVGINVFYGANRLINELVWKSLFFQEQNLWKVLQKYDGMVQGREISYSCEHRRDEMKWDVTRGECYCDIPSDNFPLVITNEHPFGENKFYDPYCGQPTLQANFFHPTIMAFRMAFEATLVDFYYFPSKIMFLQGMEAYRLAIRTILALPDIVMGNYFNVPLNCGWGDQRVAEGLLMATEIPQCFFQRHKQNQLNYCDEENKEGCTCNPSLPLEYNSTCECIFYYPDAEQEVMQTGFKNELLDNLYSAQHHWCGSYHFENYFKLADEFAYLIDDVISQFAPAYNSENNDYCESMAYKMLATDILQYSQEEWNDDLLGNISNVAYPYVEDSCVLYGSSDVICSASMTLRTGIFLITQQVRGFVMTAVAFLSLDVQGFKLDFSERLCDLQRTAAGIAATLAAMFPVGIVGIGVQKGLAMMMYSVLDISIIIIRFFNEGLLWFTDVIRGAAVGRSPETATFKLIINELFLVIDWFRRVLQAFGTFMNGIHRGAGAFFFTVDKILEIFQGMISQAVLELFALVAKVVAGIVELFAAGGVIDNFFTDLFILLTKAFNMVIQQFAKFWSLIQPALEPLMKVIRGIGAAFKSVCYVIEGAINAIPMVSVDIGCSRMRSSGHQHPFWSSPDTVLHIAENIDWDGESRCDLMIHQYKNYTWNQLRPLEQIEIQECLEQRYIAHEIANITELPIPHDLLYNWKRKYMMGYDVIHAITIYARHVFGDLTASEMMRIMKHDHVNLDLYLPALNKVRGVVQSTFTFSNMDKWVHNAFQSFPNVMHSDSGVTNMYKLYIHSSNFSRQAYPHIKQLKTDFISMHNGLKVSKVLKRNWDFVAHKEHIKSQLRNIPPLFRGMVKSKPYSQHNAQARRFVSHVLGAAGLNADIRPCHEQEDTYVCLNCLVLDNFLNTVIGEGARMANYYDTTYSKVVVPSFINYFEKQERRAKAYREDMAQQIADAFENIEIDSESTTSGDTLRSSQRANFTFGLSNTKLAAKDWEHLFLKWEVRNNRDVMDIATKFLNTVDNSYVPFTAYGLGYMITYPFIEACPMEIIYCTQSTTKERLGYISAQFGYQLAFFGGVYGAQVYTSLPLFTMVTMFPTNVIAMSSIYMYSVYGYLATCQPNIPNCFVDDLFSWLHDVAYPQCFCQYYPGLSDSCDAELCFLSSKSTVFKTCTTTVPLSSHENMGYLWSPVFWFRKEFPETFLWIYQTAPFSWILKNFDGVKDIAIRLQEGVEITLQELDCLGLRFSDFVMAGLIIYIVAFALSIIIPAAIRVAIHGLKLLIIFLNTLFAFGVATEVKTVVGIKTNYQE